MEQAGLTAVRLRAGASVEQLQAELDTVARRIEQQHASETPDYRAVRDQVRSIDPDQPIYLAMRMREALQFQTLPQRAATWLLSIFGGLAMLLAVVGLYGVVAYMVTRRTQEIGVRVALGASRPEILRLVLRNRLRLAVIGVILGIAGATVLARFASNVLYGVHPYDALAFTAGPALLFLIALLASYIPALRATKVDPIVALRYD